MPLAAGKLRHRVTIERYSYVLDSNGDPAQDPDTGQTERDFVFVADCWAAIEPLSAREFIASQATQSKVTARIIIRYRPDIDATCRIVHNGRLYQIEGVLADQDSGLEYLTLPVSLGVNQGQ